SVRTWSPPGVYFSRRKRPRPFRQPPVRLPRADGRGERGGGGNCRRAVPGYDCRAMRGCLGGCVGRLGRVAEAVLHENPRDVWMLAAPLHEVDADGLELVALRVLEGLAREACAAEILLQAGLVRLPGMLDGI